MPASLVPASLVLASVLVTAACSTGPSSRHVGAAPEAGSAACATALAAAPATVADLARTPLSVEGALSWGEPAIVLRCGLPAQLPTTAQCLGVDDLDWVVDVDGDPFVFVSYGRAPAVELTVPASYGRDRAVAAVTDVGPVARALPANGRACIGQDGTSAPAASGQPASRPSAGSPSGPAVSAGPSGG